MSSAPYNSSYYCSACRQYEIAPNKGTFKELKEEFKTLFAIDWFSYVKKVGYGTLEFQISATVREWLENDEFFCVTLSFIDCFFQREKTSPFPNRIRFQRILPNLRPKKVRKRHGNRIHCDAQYELRRMQGIAKQYRRSEDFRKIQAIKLATYAIYQMVRIYYVESAPKRIPEELFKQLCDAVPTTQNAYRRRPDGQYTTRERFPIGRLLGQAGADVIIIHRLKQFSKYMGYLKQR